MESRLDELAVHLGDVPCRKRFQNAPCRLDDAQVVVDASNAVMILGSSIIAEQRAQIAVLGHKDDGSGDLESRRPRP